MALNGYDSDGPVAAINVTPLVDVMLVLLIIFMITAPMMQSGVEVNLPKASTGALKGSNEQIVLSIDRLGDLYLGSANKIPLDGLAPKVKAIMATRAAEEQKIYIKADSGLEYGKIMTVMGRLHAAGITQIGLVTVPSAGGAGADKVQSR